MALIKCQECGKEISDTAEACPHCGFSSRSENKKKAHRLKDLGAALAIGGAAAASVGGVVLSEPGQTSIHRVCGVIGGFGLLALIVGLLVFIMGRQSE